MLAGNDAYFPEFESDDFLEEVVLTSSAASVTFSGLDAYSDYKHLQIRMVLTSDRGGTSDSFRVTFNSDTTASYASHRLYANPAAGNVRSGINNTSSNNIFFLRTNGLGASDNIYSAHITDILDFSNTSKNTTTRTLSSLSNVSPVVALESGLYSKTDAITSVNIFPDGPNWDTGSRFSLYGSKG